MAAAARAVLDGEPECEPIDPKVFGDYWASIFETTSAPAPEGRLYPRKDHPEGTLDVIWSPIHIRDVVDRTVNTRSAAGPDGIAPLKWNSVSPLTRTILYNIFLLNA